MPSESMVIAMNGGTSLGEALVTASPRLQSAISVSGIVCNSSGWSIVFDIHEATVRAVTNRQNNVCFE